VAAHPPAPRGLRGQARPPQPASTMPQKDTRLLPLQTLEAWFEKWEFKASYLMCCSDCETRTVREIMGERIDELLDLRLGYTEVRGAESLRLAIAQEFYTTMTKDDIAVFTGAEEAIYCAMSTLEPGDRVVCLLPAYQSLFACAQARGVDVSFITLTERSGSWSLDLDALEETLKGKRTRFLVINAPHNPTGWYPTAAEYARIVQLCEQSSVALFNDEVYDGLEWTEPNPAACDTSSTGVSLGVLSKAQGLAGLRLGWLATKDHALLDRCAELKLYLSICTPGPTELIGEMVIAKNRSIVNANRDLICRNFETFRQFLADKPGWFRWTPPPAGCISFPKVIHPKVTDVTRWCEKLTEKGILIMPGEVVSPEWAGYVRLGFGRKDFKDNLKVLSACLNESVSASN